MAFLRKKSAPAAGDHVSGEFGEPYFKTLVARYHNHTNPQGDQIVDKVIEEIILESAAGITWGQVFAMELAMVKIYSARELSQRMVRLRSDFKSMVCPARYSAYEAQLKPGDSADDESKLTELQNDTLYLLAEIQRLRYGTNEFEDIRTRVRNTYLLCLSCILLGSGIYAGLVFHWDRFEWSDLPYVMLSGALGALFSMAVRIARVDPNDDVETVLNTIHSFSKRAPWVPLLSVIEGMMAAIVLHSLFVSRLLMGQLFPVYGEARDSLGSSASPITHASTQPASDCSGMKDALVNFMMAHPQTCAGFALLMFWSFLAGFAERLVPDVLNQFADAASSAARRAAAGGDAQPSPAKPSSQNKSKGTEPADTDAQAQVTRAVPPNKLDPGNLTSFYNGLKDPDKVSYPKPAGQRKPNEPFFMIVFAELDNAGSGELAIKVDSSKPELRPPVTRDQLEKKVKAHFLQQAQALAQTIFKDSSTVKYINILNAADIVTPGT